MNKQDSSKYDIAFLSRETWSINLNWVQTTFLRRRVEFMNEDCQQILRDSVFKAFFSLVWETQIQKLQLDVMTLCYIHSNLANLLYCTLQSDIAFLGEI